MKLNEESKNEIESSELPLEYQVFALSFKDEGAIRYFAENLPVKVVGAFDNSLGLKEFYQSLLQYHEITNASLVDPIGFRSWLETETNLYTAINELVGIDAFIDTITHLKVSNPEQVVAILKSRANKRNQMDALAELQRVLTKKENKTDEDNEKIGQLTSRIQQLQASVQYSPQDGLTTIEDIKNDLDHIFEIPEFLETPFKEYNKALGYTGNGGYVRGALHGVVAVSGFGKSTLVKNLCNHWLDMGYKVLFINYEETRSHWEKILLSQIIEKNVYAHSESWTEEELEHYKKIFIQRLEEWGDNLKVKHQPETSYYDDLDKWLRDLIGESVWIPDIVVIDTIQSLITKASKGPRWSDYESMIINMERLAKDMNAAFILTAQQNNDALKEKREVIHQGDIGGSVSIVQKCSIISVITEKKLLDDTEDERVMQIQIPKNRITGKQTTRDMPTLLYDDESKSYKEYVLSPQQVAAQAKYDDFNDI